MEIPAQGTQVSIPRLMAPSNGAPMAAVFVSMAFTIGGDGFGGAGGAGGISRRPLDRLDQAVGPVLPLGPRGDAVQPRIQKRAHIEDRTAEQVGMVGAVADQGFRADLEQVRDQHVGVLGSTGGGEPARDRRRHPPRLKMI